LTRKFSFGTAIAHLIKEPCDRNGVEAFSHRMWREHLARFSNNYLREHNLTENIHRLYPILVLAAAAVSILLALLIVALRRPVGDPSSISAASSTSSPITTAARNAGRVGKMPDTNQAELANSRVFDGRTSRISTRVNGVNSAAE
jgi:hypothetical protein